jgi:hypothetical protein
VTKKKQKENWRKTGRAPVLSRSFRTQIARLPTEVGFDDVRIVAEMKPITFETCFYTLSDDRTTLAVEKHVLAESIIAVTPIRRLGRLT